MNDPLHPPDDRILSGRGRSEPWWFPYGRDSLDLARYYRIFGEEGILKKLTVLFPLVRALFRVRGREQRC